MTPFLENRRPVLRRFTPDDLDALVALDGDPAGMRFITGGIPTPQAEIEGDEHGDVEYALTLQEWQVRR